MSKAPQHRVVAGSLRGRQLTSGGGLFHHAKPSFMLAPAERERANWNAQVEARKEQRNAERRADRKARSAARG